MKRDSLPFPSALFALPVGPAAAGGQAAQPPGMRQKCAFGVTRGVFGGDENFCLTKVFLLLTRRKIGYVRAILLGFWGRNMDPH